MLQFIKFHIIQAARVHMLTRHMLDEIIALCVALKGELKS